MFSSRVYALLLILAMLALMLVACAETASTPGPTQTGELENTTWLLESYGEQGDLKPVLEGTEITAIFDSSKRQVHGFSGANTYSGSYDIDGSKLSILELAWTEMYRLDPEGVMEQEDQYLKAFKAAESFQVQDGTLQINSGNQILLYTDSGLLRGEVTIGPITPVEKPGETPAVPCEVYGARNIMVYDSDGTSLIKQVDIDCEGNYEVKLKPGIYMIDINNIGIDHSSDVPKEIEIKSGETVELNIDIDTGIR
ncbi:META domain-containing protein [Chloroflexota bacterium]